MKRILLVAALLAAVSCSTKSSWKPVEGHIMTRWAQDINPSSPLPEYPRPSMVREGKWKNLNGLWDYAIVPANEPAPEQFQGKILVPFAPESALSGVGRKVTPEDALWYETSFSWKKGEKTLLHFGAVDNEAQVWVNGELAGSHSGGYTAFTLDITPYLKPSGKQTLRLRVLDGSDNGRHPRGKQVLDPKGIWYTALSGIWQTVWVENVPKADITGYAYVSDIVDGTITVTVSANGGDEVEVCSEGVRATAKPGEPAVLSLPNPELWTPDTPRLYDLSISLKAGGKTADSVKGYAAIREISKCRDDEGHLRMALNGKPLFQFGPLDQGWWPDGLYTAPTDDALRFDIEKTKAFGFNMIRKHVKVEPERWYYWCDVLGMLVWQDMPSIADNTGVKWDYIGYDGTFWDAPEVIRETYYHEWGEVIGQFKNHPSIVVWVPFNEAWAQFDNEKVVAFTRALDPTRLVNQASGGNYVKGCGDIYDYHHYPNPEFAFMEADQVNAMGEYGGIGFPVKGHLWNEDGNWGYIRYESSDDVLKQYTEYAQMLKDLIRQGCAAGIYTQTTDVEGEVNGLMTYDREIVKMDEAAMREVNLSVIAAMNP